MFSLPSDTAAPSCLGTPSSPLFRSPVLRGVPGMKLFSVTPLPCVCLLLPLAILMSLINLYTLHLYRLQVCTLWNRNRHVVGTY